MSGFCTELLLNLTVGLLLAAAATETAVRGFIADDAAVCDEITAVL